MNENTPNYSGYNIPSYQDLFGNLTDRFQELAGYTDPSDISESFGFKNPEQYDAFFTPVDVSGIQEGLSAIPQLQQFKRAGVTGQYGSQKSQLQSEIGRTGLASTGSFKDKWGDVNRQYEEGMFAVDRQIQELVEGYQNQLMEQLSEIQQQGRTILAGGAKLSGAIWTGHRFEKDGKCYNLRGQLIPCE